MLKPTNVSKIIDVWYHYLQGVIFLLLPVCQHTGSGRAVQALSPLMQSPQEAVSSLAQSEKLWQNPSSGKKVNHLQD